MNKNVYQIFSILKSYNNEPTTELVYTSNFELLISVVLSAQATDISVNKATQTLYQVANSPQTIISMGIPKLESYIKTIGLYKTKAKNIYNLCKILVNEYDSQIPDTFDELIKLPGVGRKTANVVLNTLFKIPTIAVDTHVFRVSNRLGIAKGKTPFEVETKLNQIVPDEFKQDAHHWLILHGRYVCKAREPKCKSCVINKYCDFLSNSPSL